MRTVDRILVLTLACVSLFVLSLQAQMPAGPNRPAVVPEGYVITPSGYFHPSCVLEIKKGEMLLSGGRVLQHANGVLENVSPCTYPHYTPAGEAIAPDARGFVPPTIAHSWIEDASATTTSEYGELTANWDVPLAPATNNGETIFFFPGMEDFNNVVSIIQPVLGWNAASGFSQWSIASWNCCISGITQHSSFVGVASGDVLYGVIQSTCAAGTLSCPTWNITTYDLPSGLSTALNNSPSDGQNFNWAFEGALEVYNVSQCSNYPASTSLSLTNVRLYDYKFQQITSPAWSSFVFPNLTPTCNYSVQPTAPQVTLNYGTTLAQTAAPTVSNIQITSSNCGPTGCTYTYTMTLADATSGASIYYSMAACGQSRVLGSTGPGQFVYRCSGRSNQGTLYMYALAAGHNPSLTQGPFNF